MSTQVEARTIDLDAIRARAAAVDAGPWMWRGNLNPPSLRLCTRNSRRGEYTVMDFTRLGMQGGQPRFQRPDGLMDRASNPGLAIFEVCPEATSADDPRIYRTDVIGFRNATAEFIAHSRQDIEDLLAYIDELEAKVNRS